MDEFANRYISKQSSTNFSKNPTATIRMIHLASGKSDRKWPNTKSLFLLKFTNFIISNFLRFGMDYPIFSFMDFRKKHVICSQHLKINLTKINDLFHSECIVQKWTINLITSIFFLLLFYHHFCLASLPSYHLLILQLLVMLDLVIILSKVF